MNIQNDLEPKYQVSVQVLQGSTWQLRHLHSSAVCDETIYKKSKLYKLYCRHNLWESQQPTHHSSATLTKN